MSTSPQRSWHLLSVQTGFVGFKVVQVAETDVDVVRAGVVVDDGAGVGCGAGCDVVDAVGAGVDAGGGASVDVDGGEGIASALET